MQQDNKGFNADLKAKLDAAGFTVQEQMVGTLTAEFKTALQMLKVLGPRGALPFLALSTTFAKVMSQWTEAINVAPTRAVAVSEIVGEACMERAESQLANMLGMVRIPLGGGAAAQSGDCGEADCPVHGVHATGLDTTPATDPKDVN